MFDVCVVGHVVRDINTLGGVEQAPSPGGTAYYAAMAYAGLGLETAVVTRVAEADEEPLLGELRAAGVTVVNRPAERTTVFRNVYDPANPDIRRQQVDARAGTIGPRDVPGNLRTRAFHIGPLTAQDIDLAMLPKCGATGSLVALDAQGLTREIRDGEVVPAAATACGYFLHSVDILQADDSEILIFTGAADIDTAAERVRAAGADIVLVTRASQGSEVYDATGAASLDAVPPRETVDATGCGDTYLAAFLSQRIRGESTSYCALFATVAASLNIETRGPFRGSPKDVQARWAEFMRGEDGTEGIPMSLFSNL